MAFPTSVPQAATPPRRKQPGQILAEPDVRQIHARYAAGEGREALANEFGVSPATVRGIIRCDTWKKLGLPRLVERFEDRRTELAHTPAGELEVGELEGRIGAIDDQIAALQAQIKALRNERKPLSAALTWVRAKQRQPATAPAPPTATSAPSRAATPLCKPVIYFAQRADGVIRMGVTHRDLRKRLQALARQADSPITLLGTLDGFEDVPGANNQLRRLQRQFAQYRHAEAGEGWFIPSSPLLQYVRRATLKPARGMNIPAPAPARRRVTLKPALQPEQGATRLQELLKAKIARLPAFERSYVRLNCVIGVDGEALKAALNGESPYSTFATAGKFARWLAVSITEIAAVSSAAERAYLRRLPTDDEAHAKPKSCRCCQ